MVEPLPILADLLGETYGLAATQALYFLVAFLAVYLLGRGLLYPLLRRLATRRGLDTHARKPLLRIFHLLVLFTATSVGFGMAGFGSFLTSLATIAAAATLAVGFAMQDVLKNLVAGVFIYAERPFRIGDWIEWEGGSYDGVVEDISLRVTRVRTFDNELLTVPNSTLTDGVIKNPVAFDSLRLQATFGVSYDADLDAATDIILDEATADPEIMDDPEPSVRLTELGDSAVGLTSRIWIDEPSRSDFVRTKAEYVKRVKERFDEAGIEIPYPHRTLTGSVAFDRLPQEE